MGPRLFRRGNDEEHLPVARDKTASMGPRLFRRGNPRSHRHPHREDKLQWGHVFSDVEIRIRMPGLPGGETLQWGHGFSDVEIPMIELKNS